MSQINQMNPAIQQIFKRMRRRISKTAVFLAVVFAVLFAVPSAGSLNAAEGIPALPNISISIGNEADAEGGVPQTSGALQVLFLFILIALIPTILLMMTSFTRILIVLHFVRSAIGTQQMPPNQVLIGIALILSLFIMTGPLDRIYTEAYVPFQSGQISAEDFGDRLIDPLRDFMVAQMDTVNRRDYIGLFGRLAGQQITTATPVEDIPLTVIITAFVVGELQEGFTAGFYMYIPFIVIDMVVASTLMAMGMMMLPPAMISMPFKLMLFVFTDYWRSIVEVIVARFSMAGVT